MTAAAMARIMGFIFLAAAGFVAVGCSEAKEPELSARVIITVSEPILETGGAVLVVGRKIPEREWALLKADEQGRTAQEKIFHASVTSPGSVVELFYPDTGTFTFKFEPDPKQRSRSFSTELLSFGSGQMTDAETKKQINWDSISDIYVYGNRYDKRWARVFGSSVGNAFDDSSPTNFSIGKFSAGRVISLSSFALDRFVREAE